jgi:hypothetical protein
LTELASLVTHPPAQAEAPPALPAPLPLPSPRQAPRARPRCCPPCCCAVPSPRCGWTPRWGGVGVLRQTPLAAGLHRAGCMIAPAWPTDTLPGGTLLLLLLPPPLCPPARPSLPTSAPSCSGGARLDGAGQGQAGLAAQLGPTANDCFTPPQPLTLPLSPHPASIPCPNPPPGSTSPCSSWSLASASSPAAPRSRRRPARPQSTAARPPAEAPPPAPPAAASHRPRAAPAASAARSSRRSRCCWWPTRTESTAAAPRRLRACARCGRAAAALPACGRQGRPWQRALPGSAEALLTLPIPPSPLPACCLPLLPPDRLQRHVWAHPGHRAAHRHGRAQLRAGPGHRVQLVTRLCRGSLARAAFLPSLSGLSLPCCRARLCAAATTRAQARAHACLWCLFSLSLWPSFFGGAFVGRAKELSVLRFLAPRFAFGPLEPRACARPTRTALVRTAHCPPQDCPPPRLSLTNLHTPYSSLQAVARADAATTSCN